MSFTRTKRILYVLFGVLFCVPIVVSAQQTQSISVTPPLFQISVDPGGIWKSSVRVINNNPFSLTVFVQPVNFTTRGEAGEATFAPILDTQDTAGATFAEWVTVNEGPYQIEPEQSKEIEFFIEVPEDAAPGGHFAAILISTEPPPDGDVIALRTSQVVTALFFARISGDVIEKGNIREFSVPNSFAERPEAAFLLRFENKGNVHLIPRGNISITNMWGKERGIIPINARTHFGNVLPDSIREFAFAWKGEPSLTDIGRYKAIVSLTFGEDGRQNVSRTTYFWVVPVKATLITLGSLLAFILFVAWVIRLYVRRMLALAGVDVNAVEQQTDVRPLPLVSKKEVTSYKNIIAPLRIGFFDLKNRLSSTDQFFDVVKTYVEFIKSYRRFFGSLAIIIVGFVLMVLYIGDAAKDTRSYEVTIDRGDESIIVDSEEIINDQLGGE